MQKKIMSYATQDIIDTLKSAREAKGLSQRALSARTGVPQSHISKIESGGADIRLSSLIELARALDLELKLVPRKVVTAVDNIVHSTVTKAPVTPALKELNRLLETVRNLRSAYPALEALAELQSNLQAIRNLGHSDASLEQLREVTRPVRELQKLAKTTRQIIEAANLPLEQLRDLKEAARRVQILRNHIVHSALEVPSLPRPAYRLDEDGEDDHG